MSNRTSNGLVSVEYHGSQPIQHLNFKLVTFSRVVRLHLPGTHFGLIWNKPTSLLVTHPDGSEKVLPIPDPTRKWIILMALSVLLSWLLIRK